MAAKPKTSTATAAPTVVKIAGKTYKLACTLEAVERFDGMFGGLQAPLTAIQQWNISGLTNIVVAGAGIDQSKVDEIKAIKHALWVGGEDVEEAYDKIVDYVTLLRRGGRPKETDDTEEASGEGDSEGKA